MEILKVDLRFIWNWIIHLLFHVEAVEPSPIDVAILFYQQASPLDNTILGKLDTLEVPYRSIRQYNNLLTIIVRHFEYNKENYNLVIPDMIRIPIYLFFQDENQYYVNIEDESKYFFEKASLVLSYYKNAFLKGSQPQILKLMEPVVNNLILLSGKWYHD
jgi:hypothetical protein